MTILFQTKYIYDALMTGGNNQLIAWSNDLNELAILLYQAGYDMDSFLIPSDIIITKRNMKNMRNRELSKKEYGQFYSYFMPLFEEENK